MTRYQALRSLGVGPFTSGVVAFLNYLVGAPEGKIGIFHMVISYDPDGPYEKGMRSVIEDLP